MKLLIISTASQCCFVSVVCDDFSQTNVFSSYQKTSEFLLPQIDKLLRKNKLSLDKIDAVAVCTGPGSFTGIRVGVSTAKAFCLAKNKPVIAFNVFDAFLKEGTLLTKANSGGAYCKKGDDIFFLNKESLQKLSDKNVYVFEQEKNYFEGKNVKTVDIIENTIKLCKDKFEKKEFVKYNQIYPVYVLNSQAENELEKDIKNAKVVPLDISFSKDIFELEQECFSDFYSIKSIEEMVKSEKNKVFGLLLKNKLVAYASFSCVLDEAELERVCVVKKFRNLNLATFLLKECFKKISAKRIFLEVNKNNEYAIKLYVKLGFEKMGLRKNYYGAGEDAITMQKVF